MVFTSHIFVYYFLPLLLLVYYNLPYRGRNLFLTLMSYVFYGWWNPWFVLLMFFTTVANYACGKAITAAGSRPLQRKMAVSASVVISLGVLGFFKYYMFFSGNVNILLSWVGTDPLAILNVTLPIGISFYTFQALSYSVDIYRGDARPARSFLDFACFVSLFPQLIAGPIIRYHTVAEQLVWRDHTSARFASGTALFILGFAKKILVANPLGEVADAAFAANSPAALDAWFGVLAYAFQIYFDFCGYSDMAVGLGRMLGFEFMKNFNAPYVADSITDFWHRWHVSLSTFLRDYLYIPLGGNRKGARRTYLNLATVMLFGGLWHGANWTFVVWGALHGTLLVIERLRGKQSAYGRLPHVLRVGITFVLVLITWVFFRAEDLSSAIRYLSAMCGWQPAGGTSVLLPAELYTLRNMTSLIIAGMLVWQPLQAHDWTQRRLTLFAAAALMPLFVLALAVMSGQAFNPFLYFQF